MKRPREILFQILCIAASTVLLVTSLLYGVRLTQRNQQAAQAKAAVETLRKENTLLQARCAFRWSLEEVEHYAREELGMQQLSAEQIVKTEYAG